MGTAQKKALQGVRAGRDNASTEQQQQQLREEVRSCTQECQIPWKSSTAAAFRECCQPSPAPLAAQGRLAAILGCSSDINFAFLLLVTGVHQSPQLGGLGAELGRTMPPVRNSQIPTCPLPPGPPSSGNTRDFGRGAPRTRWGLAFPLLIRKNLTGDNGGVRGAASRAGQRGLGQEFSSAARSWIYPSSAGAVRGQEEPGQARFNPELLLEFRCSVKNKTKQNKRQGWSIQQNPHDPKTLGDLRRARSQELLQSCTSPSHCSDRRFICVQLLGTPQIPFQSFFSPAKTP